MTEVSKDPRIRGLPSSSLRVQGRQLAHDRGRDMLTFSPSYPHYS